MNEVIKYFELGYFQAIEDILNDKKERYFKISLELEFKSKIYDIGYIIGYQKYNEYIKNNL